jgi:hypothetical protein
MTSQAEYAGSIPVIGSNEFERQTEDAVVGRQRGLVNDRDRVAIPIDSPAN